MSKNRIYLMNNLVHKIQGISVVDKDLFLDMIDPIFYYHDGHLTNSELKNELNKSIELEHVYFDISKTISLKQNLDEIINHDTLKLFHFDSINNQYIELYDMNHRNLNILSCNYTFNDIHKKVHSYIRKLFNYNETEESNNDFCHFLFISKESYNSKDYFRNDKMKMLSIDKKNLINDLYEKTINGSIFNTISKDTVKDHNFFEMEILNDCLEELLLNLNESIFNDLYIDYLKDLRIIEHRLNILQYLGKLNINLNKFKDSIIINSKDIIELIDKMNSFYDNDNNPFNEIKDLITYYQRFQ